ncbi:hypothetical protein C8Q76DRAFT_738316 [Earliella scabrosa]|nr:hypothetical protein C8Q76DRAFT_738316 [Earliella scabrosa]
MKTLTANAARISKLIVVSLDNRTMSLMENLLSKTPMPALTELWINTVPHTTDTQRVPDLQPPLLPSLRKLEATYLRFDWQSPILPRLRQLYLGPSPSRPFPLESFLYILQSCQSLEFLKIDRAFPLYSDRDRSKHSISLPKLRQLYLVTEYPWEVRQLLSHVYLDAATEIDIRVRIDLEGTDDRFASLGLLDVVPQDTSCLPVLRTASYAVLRDFDFQCVAPGGRGRLSVAFDEVQADAWLYTIKDAVQQSGRLLARAPLTALSIYQRWSDPIPTVDLARLLHRFPYINWLEYTGLQTGQTDLASAIMPPAATVNPDGSMSQPPTILPQLRHLRLVRAAWDDKMLPRLMDSLRARYRTGTWLESLLVELQDRPRHQHSESYQRWALTELQKLVRGPVCLYG